jgi:hypothetical protein
VKVAARPGGVSWPVHLGPCDGGVYLVSPRPVEQVTIAAPAAVPRGQLVNVAIRVADASGQPVPAVIPLDVSVTDPHGRPAERTGHHAARDGQLTLELDLASNDTPGIWQIQVRERAAGLTATHFLRVTP